MKKYVKYIIGAVSALVVTYLLAIIGCNAYLAGWLSCTVYFAVVSFSEIKENVK